ncbi:MAG: hypothetical protein CFK52_12815 [Chloracidobacterium sp. CP2_5A]|nr:MAG: hypothetical protein CFK52_12815 [Chloracidobacterium sp. CP2_5A]
MTTAYIHRLNLSATPFRNRRLFWLGLTAAFGLLLAAVTLTSRHYAQLAGDEQRYIELRDASRAALEREQAQLAKSRARSAETGLQPAPEQARAMREALYLLERKELSWSRLLLQMEQQLPSDIRVMQIAFVTDSESAAAPGNQPKTEKDADTPLPGSQEVPFIMTVRAPKPEAVTAFIRGCDERGIFRFDPNTQANPNDERSSGGKKEVEFTLRGRYRPNGNRPAADGPALLEAKR